MYYTGSYAHTSFQLLRKRALEASFMYIHGFEKHIHICMYAHVHVACCCNKVMSLSLHTGGSSKSAFPGVCSLPSLPSTQRHRLVQPLSLRHHHHGPPRPQATHVLVGGPRVWPPAHSARPHVHYVWQTPQRTS